MTASSLPLNRPILQGSTAFASQIERESRQFGFMKGDPNFPKEARPTAKGSKPVVVGELLRATGAACVMRNEKQMKLWFFPELMLLVEYDNSVHMVARQAEQPMQHRWWHRQNGGAFWPIHAATAAQLDSMLQEYMDKVTLD